MFLRDSFNFSMKGKNNWNFKWISDNNFSPDNVGDPNWCGNVVFYLIFKIKNRLDEVVYDNIQQLTGATALKFQAWFEDRTLDLNHWRAEENFVNAVKDNFIGKSARVPANKKMTRLKADYGYYEDISTAE